MLRMIIADDEPVIIRGIQKLISWESLGIEVAGTFEDGQGALNGILSLKPDIALMDIAMPEKDGIQVLKELKQMEVHTEVIFISGYQNFSYAQNAIKYGAADYLLKPVIEEELLRAVEKCMLRIREGNFPNQEHALGGGKPDGIPYEELHAPEDTGYLTVYVAILFEDEGEAERQLITFSVKSFLEKKLKQDGKGIAFEKDGAPVLVLKGRDKEAGKEYLAALAKEAERARGHKLGMAVGRLVDGMNEIPGQYQELLLKKDYFYFSGYLPSLFLDVEQNVFAHKATEKEIGHILDLMMQAMLRQDMDKWKKGQEQLFKAVCMIADGRREDACFYLCSSLNKIEAKLVEAGLAGIGPNIGEILEKSRGRRNYQEMTDCFRELFDSYEKQVKEQAAGNEKKDIIKVKEYIHAHYSENITLETLAKEIHMNPYYLSAYFKKQAGKNFKEYLNETRLKHAVALLLTTDKMAYEIAEEVGYRDSRTFSDAFQKFFGETPSGYRKRLREQ